MDLFSFRYFSEKPEQLEPKDNELSPLKLPGQLSTMTGNVLYPNEESSVWDVNGESSNVLCYSMDRSVRCHSNS